MGSKRGVYKDGMLRCGYFLSQNTVKINCRQNARDTFYAGKDENSILVKVFIICSCRTPVEVVTIYLYTPLNLDIFSRLP